MDKPEGNLEAHWSLWQSAALTYRLVIPLGYHETQKATVSGEMVAATSITKARGNTGARHISYR